MSETEREIPIQSVYPHDISHLMHISHISHSRFLSPYVVSLGLKANPYFARARTLDNGIFQINLILIFARARARARARAKYELALTR